MTGKAIVDAPTQDTRRVSLRWERGSDLTEVVGYLIAANDEWLVVLPEDREAVWVPRHQAKALREVPPRLVLPASGPEAVQRVLDATWPGIRRARLGGWVLRKGPGSSFRASSALAIGDPGRNFEAASALADEWAGGPLPLQVVIGSTAQREGRAAGRKLISITRVMVLPTHEAMIRPAPEVRISPSPEDRWLDLWSHRGDEGRAAEMTAAPASYLTFGDEAIGRVAMTRNWAVLTDVQVAKSARGRGLGRAVTRALMSHAAESGAAWLALGVEQSNPVAQRLYESLGFEEHHRYGYLING